jgi:hypothetical protein
MTLPHVARSARAARTLHIGIEFSYQDIVTILKIFRNIE